MAGLHSPRVTGLHGLRLRLSRGRWARIAKSPERPSANQRRDRKRPYDIAVEAVSGVLPAWAAPQRATTGHLPARNRRVGILRTPSAHAEVSARATREMPQRAPGRGR